MTEFKVGDRVMAINSTGSNNCKNKVGTVINIEHPAYQKNDRVEIEFDEGQNINYGIWWVYNEDIRLISISFLSL